MLLHSVTHWLAYSILQSPSTPAALTYAIASLTIQSLVPTTLIVGVATSTTQQGHPAVAQSKNWTGLQA